MIARPRLPVDPLTVLKNVVRNPAFAGVVRRTLQVRGAAQRTQEAVLGALNLPTAAELNTVATRLRSMSQRLELLEDAVERVDRNVVRLPATLDRAPATDGP